MLVAQKVEGRVDVQLEPLRATLEQHLADGRDIGASLAMTIQGEEVADLWGGWANEERNRPWERDTLINVYSTTKTIMALCALLLADRGELDFDDPVMRYWPEFGAAGKEGVRVSHLLAHSAGLSGWREPMTINDLYDWQKATELLAKQSPFWEPGTAPGYHGLTQGYLVGEVVRRITGLPIGRFFRQELGEPAGIDFHIGLPEEEDHRVADLIPFPSDMSLQWSAQSALEVNFATNPPINPLDTRTRAWRAAEIPAGGGHGNARSVARAMAILANGGWLDGKRFLTEAGCREALKPQIEGWDLVLGEPVRYGLGFGLSPMVPGGDGVAFWGGLGGSLAIVDFDAGTSFSYVMNRMVPSRMRESWCIAGDRGLGLWKCAAAALRKTS